MVFLFEAIQAFDDSFLHAVQNVFAGTQGVFWIITLLGHPALWLFLAAVLYWNSQEKKAFWLVSVIVFVSVVCGALKVFFARPRPDPSVFVVSKEHALISQLGETALAFPSGHSATITAILVFFYAQVKNQIKKFNFNPIVFCILVIALVSLSRLVLGQHFLSDVITGILIGVLVGWAAWQTHLRLEKKGFKLSKMDDELGFLLTLVLAICLMVAIAPPLLTAVALGFYAGFFCVQETGFLQSVQKKERRIAKTVVGLIGILILMVWGLGYTEPMAQFLVFFAAGIWVSLVWPLVFERVFSQSKKPLKHVPKHN